MGRLLEVMPSDPSVTLASFGEPFGEAGVACAGNRVAVLALEGFLPEDGLADLDDPNGFFHILFVFNGVVWPGHG